MQEKIPEGGTNELLLRHLSEVNDVVAAVIRRNRLDYHEAEDFRGYVHLRLIESECAALRAFKGTSSFSTYLTTVIVRFHLDYRNTHWGRFRNSARARSAGPAVTLLERLVYMKRLPLAEALSVVRKVFPDADENVLRRLFAELPVRRLGVRLDDVGEQEIPIVQQEDGLERTEVSAALRQAVSELSQIDAITIQLHLEQGLSLAKIAQLMGTPPKDFYRAFARLKVRLGRRLAELGVDRLVVREFLSGDT